MAKSVELTALTDDENITEPSEAVQYAVRLPDDRTVRVYGDQSWVRSGEAAQELAGTTVVRDITLIFGPWRKAVKL